MALGSLRGPAAPQPAPRYAPAMSTRPLRLAIGSDERLPLYEHVLRRLREAGHELDEHGPEPGVTAPWPDVAERVALRVASGEADGGVLFCWTGTGVSIAANKVAGVRAALCGDAQTAAGARKWNDANVLVLSLRATSLVVADEILEAWFSNGPAESEAERLAELAALDRRHRRG